MDAATSTAIVLDLGTDSLKAGRSCFTSPEFVLPNTVGRPILCLDESFSRKKLKDVMISDDTTPVRQYLGLSHPVDNGIISNWEDEKLILDYIFRQKSTPVL
jgi:actin-related protein 2